MRHGRTLADSLHQATAAPPGRRWDDARLGFAGQTKFIAPAGSDLVNVLGLDDKSVVPVKK